MMYIESGCVNCDLPCLYSSCKYYEVVHYRCDECGEEDVTLYEFDGQELCIDCVAKQLQVVDGSDAYEY